MPDQTPGGRTVLICCATSDETGPLADALGQHSEVQQFDSVAKALDWAQSARNLDLIIADTALPNMDGYAMLDHLKAAPNTRNIPMVLLATADQAKAPDQALKHGAADIIETPVNLALTLARLDTLLDLKRKSDLLENVARLDPDTGLPNRRQFDDMLATEWRRGLRSRASLSVLMIGADGSTEPAQDTLALAQISGVLTTALTRPGDLAAHGGGDSDFVIVLPNTNGTGAIEVAERIRDQVSKLARPTATLDGQTVSIGVASTIPSNQLTPDTFTAAAQAMLHAAQSAGAGRIQGRTLSAN